MDGSIIIAILVVALIVWVLFFKKINPSNKTDAQLQMMYDMAMRNWDPLKKNENLELLQAEMERRGLLGDTSAPLYSRSDHETMAESGEKIEKSGMQVELQKAFDSGLSEKIFNKVIEIAKSKGIPEHEASALFNEEFESASHKYRDMGLSQNEADDKALNDALAKEFK